MTVSTRHAFWLLARHDIYRYLMSCTHGRYDGHEKATRHAELCSKYIALVYRVDVDSVVREYPAAHRSIHDHTQKLTSCMDTEIGFPVGDPMPDYDVLAGRFLSKFVALAEESLP